MKFVYVVIAAAVVARVLIARARRQRRRADTGGGDTGPTVSPGSALSRRRRPGVGAALERRLGDVGLVAGREIRERVRGRIFRIGTILLLLAVAAAIIVPKVTSHSGSGPTRQSVALVRPVSPAVKQIVQAAGRASEDVVRIVPEPSRSAAEAGLRSGRIDLAVVSGDQILLNLPASASASPADPSLVTNVAAYLGLLRAYRVGHLTSQQERAVDGAKPVAVITLRAAPKPTTSGASLFGLILLFFLLTQYNTWTLIGVMQEKSSRVVEVLLATVRPLQLLGGKVLGIGAVALGQATLVVGVALILAKAVGSTLLHGTAPLVLASQLLWLVLGYAFYCWVYAAAGSTAERQDQVQTLALPLSIPILAGYVLSLTTLGSGHASTVFELFAYLPPTAPFCMPVLVGFGQVPWWGFVASVLISLAGTVAMAMFAARIYRRAVLRTGGRVGIRHLVSRSGA